jgi:hypothetical protein
MSDFAIIRASLFPVPIAQTVGLFGKYDLIMSTIKPFYCGENPHPSRYLQKEQIKVKCYKRSLSC